MTSRLPPRLLTLLLGLALCVGVTVTPARRAEAQIIPQSLELDVFGGYYWFVSNLENLKPAPIFGARLGVNFVEFIGFEASLGYAPSSTVHGGRVAHYLNPNFDLVIHTTPWRVIPYFQVGAGFQSYIIDTAYRRGVAPPTGTVIRDPYVTPEQEALGSLKYDARDIDFTFNAGGGIKFLIFDRGGLRLDARYILSIGDGQPEDDGVPAWQNRSVTDVVWNDMFHHIELTGSFFVLLGGGGGKDSDGDGLADRVDECPEQPEDKDDFEDSDGCPDRDNDGDGVLDRDDQCPLVAEDLDGWRDTDGCPEADNDGDGLKDTEDGCPDQAEDPDGYKDGDGCPEVDNDSDGIPDDRDRCPLEAEDKDGFRDDDGCPDPDDDADGVADLEDACPLESEDVDGFEDGDGCPDPDDDGDGLADEADACPREAEDVDGYEDDDGCPEEDPVAAAVEDPGDAVAVVEEPAGPSPAQLLAGVRVRFAFGVTEPDSASEAALREVLALLAAEPGLRLRIEGHTDDVGSTAGNQSVSEQRARAVRAWLIERGGSELAQRLEIRGYGESRPALPNDSEANRALNRRVELVVQEPPGATGPRP